MVKFIKSNNMKNIISIIALVLLFSCSPDYEKSNVRATDIVSLELTDSTKWQQAIVFVDKRRDKIYYSTQKNELIAYDITSNNDTFGLVFLLMVLIFLLILVIGSVVDR